MMQALRTRPTLRRSGLLKLPEDVLAALRENGLSERHGRALLRLPDADSQRAALEHILEKGLTVAAADAYVDALLTAPEPPARPSPAELSSAGDLFLPFFLMILEKTGPNPLTIAELTV